MIQIPKWLDNPEIPRPCPCGYPPMGNCVMVKIDGALMWLHEECSRGIMEGDDES
jgi:hypothetical protein